MVIFEATKFSAYVLFSLLIAAQVFEAPSRPSQQLTSGDYGDLCQRELASHACLWPLLRFGPLVMGPSNVVCACLRDHRCSGI